MQFGSTPPWLFQPALPMRGVTERYNDVDVLILFQPALPMRGVTLRGYASLRYILISTRTPHAGSDRSCGR